MTHPTQPIVWDGDVIRFKPNHIVRYLLDAARNAGVADLNAIGSLPFTAEDRVQFAQLIGYSVSGFGELSYVPKEAVDKCDDIAAEMWNERHKPTQSETTNRSPASDG